MKKFLCLATIFFVIAIIFTGCANIDKPEPEAPAKQVESKVNGYQIGARNYAVGDENGDLYFITTKHVGKINALGEVTIISEGFQFGNDIALHNNYVYTLRGTALFRTDKNGDNEYEFPSQFEYGINTIYICDDILYVTTVSNEGSSGFYYADISDDPDTLDFLPGTKDFDRQSFIEEAQIDYAEEHLTEYENNGRVYPLEVTDKYAYFYTPDHELGRLDRETHQAEILLGRNVAYSIENTSIVNGWIIYADSSTGYYKLSEDLSVNEMIYQDTRNEID